jgi:hypothetical protein
MAASRHNQGLAWSVNVRSDERRYTQDAADGPNRRMLRFNFNLKNIYIGTYSKYVKCFFRNCMS